MISDRPFRFSAIILAGLFGAVTNAEAGEVDLSIPSGERTPLAAKLIVPEGPGPFATLIIAPGGGYDMEQPLTGGLARAAADAGFASLRFDWRFYKEASARPSENLSTETKDLKEIAAFARSDSRLDTDRIFLAGKSLGSLVTWRVASADSEIRATYLLTPICRQLGDNGQNANYPSLLETEKPVVLVLGNRDPLCPLPNLYKWLGPANNNISTLVFGGNHGMKLSPEAGGLTVQNEQRAIEAVVHWLTIHNHDLDSSQRYEIQE